jgi:hypothetical protein
MLLSRCIERCDAVCSTACVSFPHSVEVMHSSYSLPLQSSPELIDEALIEAEGLEVLWGHWVMHGQFAARPVRWHCPR